MQSTPPQENTQPYPTRRIKIPPFPQSPFKPNVTSNQTSADINNISTAENSPNTKTISNLKFPSKTSTLPCFALNLLEQKGSIQSFKRGDTFYIIKLQKVNIEDNYLELLDKGKTNLGNYFEQEIGSIPDISFWHQRYYYYTEFDKGIKMDYESWYSVTPEPIAKYSSISDTLKSCQIVQALSLYAKIKAFGIMSHFAPSAASTTIPLFLRPFAKVGASTRTIKSVSSF
jgi:hypothetical protein